eukprot:TRINITY_DN61055_c0_g1_i1.p1 TRINITY_DN61055_c0_g1~~TRINITY_DN61055_c0_g1_i1.p1  ORF type:complete len:873 (+),score=158.27 TRINITY_DN61055_c0_g1_i1:40-2619(+)
MADAAEGEPDYARYHDEQGDGDESLLPGSVVAVPPLNTNMAKAEEIPAPPPRKPPPLRNSTLSPWLLASRAGEREQAEEDELLAAPNDYAPPSSGTTPRSGGGFSHSTGASTAPYSLESKPALIPSLIKVDEEDFADKAGITLSQLEEFLAVKKGMRLACGTLPMTFAVWLAYVFLVVNLGDGLAAFEGSNLIAETVTTAYARRPLPGQPENSTERRVFQLHSMEEYDDIAWWLKTALLPVIDPFGPAMSGTQKMVGFSRVLQLKGSIGGCSQLSPNLQAFYPGSCYPTLPQGATVPSFGPHLADDAFRELGPDRPPGEFEAWLDAGRSIQVLESRVQNLIDHDWIDLMTHEVKIDGTFVNLQTNVYSRMNLHVKLRREGGIDCTLRIVPLRAEVVTHWSHVFINLVFTILLVMQLVFFFQQSFVEYSRGLYKLHFRDMWTWLDIGCIVLALVLVLMAVAYAVNTATFTKMISELGDMPEYDTLTAPESRKVQAFLENQQYRQKVAATFDMVDSVQELGSWVRFMSAWYAVALCCRFYRGFTGQPRTSVIIQSVMYMSNLFLHYLIVLGVVLGNFALSGYILFGEQVQGWSTFGGALNQLIALMLGEYDYADLKNVAPITSMIWWWIFFFSVTVVLAKCLTAAVVAQFLEVRQALGEPGVGLPVQISTFIRNAWYQRSYEGSMKSMPDEDLLDMLASDLDPAHVKKLMQMKSDRRLRNREDLAKAEKDIRVDLEFLVERGMDPVSAQRLIDRTMKWAGNISTTSSATNRLMLLIAKQMDYIRNETERIQRKIRGRIDRAAQSADRVDVKHAKCAALAKRLKRAQKVPHGWTVHRDESGRRYLRHEESGLTSWNLPRALV